jgi:histidinol-phosphate aminotransferase
MYVSQSICYMATFSFQNLLRPNIRTLQPYPSARSEFSGRADIFLNANENAFGSPLDIVEHSTTINSHHLALHRYPDPLAWAVKERYGAIKGIAPEQIFLGMGSDEAIDMLLRMFCVPGHDSIIVMPPTFVMYASYCAIHDIGVRSVPLITKKQEPFQIDVPAVLSAIDTSVKIVVICSPNNPTGNLMREEDILSLARQVKCMIVVDEAYIEFTERKSMIARLQEFPNVVVLQTFSKALGLAGLRVGAAFASAEIIRVMNTVKAPYNLSAVTQQLALEALEQTEWVARSVNDILHERAQLVQALHTIPILSRVYPTDANFILVETADAIGLYTYLLGQGVVVRLRKPDEFYGGGLRLTVGTPQENMALLSALRSYATPA